MSEPMRVLLVGAGVVGRAIATDHLRAGCEVWLADQSELALRDACDEILERTDGVADSASPWGAAIPLPVVHLFPQANASLDDSTDRPSDACPLWLVIESIAERLPVKQAFFAAAETWFTKPPILTTNTSTLSITQIAASMRGDASRLCGMHFFMPVVGRHAAEIIVHDRTSRECVAVCETHVRRLGKTPLPVRDAPGFVVNRMLTPYLNLAMRLLCAGVSEQTIRDAALSYGMPMSPLELIDLIGPRTAFDGGRIVWQSFPGRMDPSPLLPAMVKHNLMGVMGGKGFYLYDDHGTRVGDGLSDEAAPLVDKYARDDIGADQIGQDVSLIAKMFACVMRRQADAILSEHVADAATIDAAMKGGLAYDSPGRSCSWSQYVAGFGDDFCDELAARFTVIKSLQRVHHSL